MSREKENAGFVCENCGREVLPLSNGTYRNHCPFCLFSKHVDIKPGDRQNKCGGLMRPVRLRYKSGKGFQIVHRCLQCGEERVNKVTENLGQPDDIEEIIKLSGI
ncbi:MAG TPA: RNHCP domain-containing protein [Dehalococcoidia bacterium]|nr:RNHCP domain-containing protein [Dehalococcoidia bacterium]